LQLSSKRRLEARCQGPDPHNYFGRGDPPVLLSPDPQLGDERPVALDIVAAQVVQQPAPLADQDQEATPGVVVLLMGLQMRRELTDALSEDRDLDLR
jgi:hypothetical protein